MQKLIVALAPPAPRRSPRRRRSAPRSGSTPRRRRPRPSRRPRRHRLAREEDGHSNRKDTIPLEIRGRPRPRWPPQCTIQIATRTPSTRRLLTGRFSHGLQALAYEQTPSWATDPELSLEFFDESNTATIGFLRQAELKHGRVAMAGFVGYLVQQGITWPPAARQRRSPATASTASFTQVALQDDARRRRLADARRGRRAGALGPDPEGAKWQIIAGCLEWYDEWQYDNPAAEMLAMADKPKHYMRGGQPGIYRVEINRRHGDNGPAPWRDNSTPSEAPEIRCPHRCLPALRGPPAQPLRPLQPLQAAPEEKKARPQRRGEQRLPGHDRLFPPRGVEGPARSNCR